MTTIPPVVRLLLLVASLVTCLACADSEDGAGDTSATSSGEARVGESCEETADCKEGLACLAGEQRCVLLCEPGSDQCGEGIACMTAGEVGFCPPPALPDDGAGSS
ncbi:MAG: hypothetical protein CMH57_10555 [Myxococcales bacterium]|nr:hypothetical protein [Myxococcales bacterium]